MKIVIISAAKTGDMSGVGRVLTEIFPLLQKKTDISWKVCPGSSFIIKKTNLHPFVKLFTLGVLTLFALIFDKDIRRADIINGHGIDSWLPTIWLAKIFNKISIITLHETYKYTKLPWFCGGGRWAQWLWNYTMKNSDYFIDVSGTLKKENAFFVPNGINLEIFKPKQEKKHKKTVLIVCRLSIEKGIEYFVEASRMIKKELDVRFVAVTNTSTSARQNNFYTNLLNDNGIGIQRQIPLAEIQKFYEEADVLVLPSLMEAFPLVIFEAMACGTPVVATDVGGVRHAIKDGEVGFIVAPKNPQQITEKVLSILKDENLRTEMSKNCLEWVKNFIWDEVADKYLEVYKKINENRRKE